MGTGTVPAGDGSLADRLNRLFHTMHPANRGEFTLQEVVDGIQERGGPTISMTYLWQLRKGLRDNPTKQHLEALATFFEVPVAYFFDDTVAKRVEAQLELLTAMRDAGVREIALRAAELTPEGQRAVAVMIEQVLQLQKASGEPSSQRRSVTE